MSLDQKMIISVLNSLKVLNVRFRAPDMTDAIRDQLRPIMVEIDENCMVYIRLLREPDNITTTVELTEYRAISKSIKNATLDTLVAKVTTMKDFIINEIDEVLVLVVDEDEDESDDNTDNPSETDDNPNDDNTDTDIDTDTDDEPTDTDDPVSDNPTDTDDPVIDEPTDDDIPT